MRLCHFFIWLGIGRPMPGVHPARWKACVKWYDARRRYGEPFTF